MSLSTRLNLSREQQEIACNILLNASLNDNEWIANERKQLLTKLSQVYEHGDKDTLRDKNKAQGYRHHLYPNEAQASLLQKSIIVNIHQWFTATRIALVRFNRFLSYVNRGFLPKLFNFFGLSYGVTFLLDLIIIGIDVFDPTLSEHEKNLTFTECILQRLAIAFSDRERLARMIADFMWFNVNLLMIILLGPVAILWLPVVGLIGNAHDVLHDGIFSWINNNIILDLKNKIDLEIEKNNDTIQKLNNDLKRYDTLLTKEIQNNYAIYNETLAQQKRAIELNNTFFIKRTDIKLSMIKELAPAKNNRLITDLRNKITTLEKEKKALMEENAALQRVSHQSEKNLEEADRVATRIVIGAIVVVVGICLTCLFPPVGVTFTLASLPGLIGAGLAITGSCLMRGACPLIFNALKNLGQKLNQFFNPPSIVSPDLIVKLAQPKPKESTLAMKRLLNTHFKNNIADIPKEKMNDAKVIEYKPTIVQAMAPRKLGMR